MANGNIIQSVAKAADVLKLVGNSEQGLRLNEIAQQLNMKVPATHHMVSTLLAAGFLARRNGEFMIGSELCELVLNSKVDNAFNEAITRELRRLYNALPRCVVVVAAIRSYNVELTHRISYERPNILQDLRDETCNIFANAVAILALAYADRELREHLEEKQPFVEMGQHLWGNRAKLEAFLEQARRERRIILPFDQEIAFRVAMPVLNSDGKFECAIGVSITASQLKKESDKQSVIDHLHEAVTHLQEEFQV